MQKAEKLTVVLERPERDELAQWPLEEDRPVSNLLRRLVIRSLEARRQQRGERAA